MTTKMNKNGVSTCKAGEKYEKFQMTIGRKKRTFYHYDYRDTADNELFSCVKPTLEECRRLCNEWLKKKEFFQKKKILNVPSILLNNISKYKYHNINLSFHVNFL